MDINKVQEQFNSIAKKYDSQRKILIPLFDNFYKDSVSLLKYYRNDFKHIVDLGAGTGLLTKEIYELYANAHFTLIDISNDMLEIARQRFKGLDNFEFLQLDYAKEMPIPKCDLICSALSIHHLENTEKGLLYKNIYKTLENGGCFINLDMFNSSSEIINDLYNKSLSDYREKNGMAINEKHIHAQRIKLDRENSVSETIDLLAKSGFKHIECVYSFIKFSSIIAIK
jgi:ubiquinone/menaquinone biosynthesis C-methylase UbiE